MASVATKRQTRTDEVGELQAENRSLKKQVRHAQRLATVGTMTAMIVHEFNNILTPIINYAQEAARCGDEELVAKALSKAETGGLQACDICGALLNLLRDRGVEPVEVGVLELVHESLLAMGRNLAKDGIELKLEIPEDLRMTTRPTELKQVLVNLVLNARSALRKKGRGGQLAISATEKKTHLHLRVADTGTGIDPEHMRHLFEPFFTTKNGDGEEGTGLGLALCKEIVEDMNGRIIVDSTPGAGTAFTLILPTA